MVHLPSQRDCDCDCITKNRHSRAQHATMSASTHSSATDIDVGSSNDAPQVEAPARFLQTLEAAIAS